MNKQPEHPRKALGRGLTALLGNRELPARSVLSSEAAESEWVLRVPTDMIEPNPFQSRSIFRADRLQELAQSIQANGVIQPLIVRRKEGKYQLVAGERRWRAAKLVGLDTVPVVVQDLSDAQLLEITLVENIQREDLSPIEVARALERLVKELHLSHEEIAKRTGKDRSTITNTLRLLRLPLDVQQLLAEHRLSMGHARAILSLPNEQLQRQLAEKTAAQSLSVREVERLVQKMSRDRDAKPSEQSLQDPNVKAAAVEMERILGTRVRIVEKSEHRGRIEIEYYSPEDLQRIYSLIVRD
jgi:ParB family chromosome partitioning protein